MSLSVCPREGWEYVGCPTCGNVTTAPIERDEAEGLPYCVHNGVVISWLTVQHPFAITGWTRMVRVDAVVRDA